jgi:hypothetical protein
MVVVAKKSSDNSSVIGEMLCYVSVVSKQWLGFSEAHPCVVHILRMDCDRTPSVKAKSSPGSLPFSLRDVLAPSA